MMAPPKGYRQVEIVTEAETFAGARVMAAKLQLVEQTNVSRQRAVHYSVRDYFTIMEVPAAFSEQEVKEAFFSDSAIQRELLN